MTRNNPILDHDPQTTMPEYGARVPGEPQTRRRARRTRKKRAKPAAGYKRLKQLKVRHFGGRIARMYGPRTHPPREEPHLDLAFLDDRKGGDACPACNKKTRRVFLRADIRDGTSPRSGTLPHVALFQDSCEKDRAAWVLSLPVPTKRLAGHVRRSIKAGVLVYDKRGRSYLTRWDWREAFADKEPQQRPKVPPLSEEGHDALLRVGLTPEGEPAHRPRVERDEIASEGYTEEA